MTKKRRDELICMAWREAAQAAERASEGDLNEDLNEEEDEFVRSYLRINVSEELLRKGTER